MNPRCPTTGIIGVGKLFKEDKWKNLAVSARVGPINGWVAKEVPCVFPAQGRPASGAPAASLFSTSQSIRSPWRHQSTTRVRCTTVQYRPGSGKPMPPLSFGLSNSALPRCGFPPPYEFKVEHTAWRKVWGILTGRACNKYKSLGIAFITSTLQRPNQNKTKHSTS